MERNIYSNLKPQDRGRIIGLYEAGHKKTEIANIIGCNRHTVSLWIKKYEEGGMDSLKDHRKNNKRPKKTTEQDQEIIEAVNEHPFEAAANVLRDRNLNISERTVRRRLNAANVQQRKKLH